MPPARVTAAATALDGVKAKIGYSIPNSSLGDAIVAEFEAELLGQRGADTHLRISLLASAGRDAAISAAQR